MNGWQQLLRAKLMPSYWHNQLLTHHSRTQRITSSMGGSATQTTINESAKFVYISCMLEYHLRIIWIICIQKMNVSKWYKIIPFLNPKVKLKPCSFICFTVIHLLLWLTFSLWRCTTMASHDSRLEPEQTSSVRWACPACCHSCQLRKRCARSHSHTLQQAPLLVGSRVQLLPCRCTRAKVELGAVHDFLSFLPFDHCQ